jgi:hypothetical protein
MGKQYEKIRKSRVPKLGSFSGRKAGITAELVLSVALDSDCKVKAIRVVKSLSPRIDETRIEATRSWRFEPLEENPNTALDVFQLHLLYRALCSPEP